MKSKHFCLLVFLLAHITLLAQDIPVIKITEQHPLQLIGAQVGVYEDRTGEMPFSDILRQESTLFAPHQGETINYGYSSSAIWIKANIENHTDEALYIQVIAPGIDTLAFYAVADDGQIVQLVSGYHSHFENRDLKISLPTFRIPEEYTTVFIKARGRESLLLPIRLGTASAIITAMHPSDVLSSALIGFVFFMLLYSLITWFMTKEAMYLYYFPLLLVIALSMIHEKGYDTWLIPAITPIWHVLFPILCLITLPFYLKFLEISRQKHRGLYWVYVLIGLAYACIVLMEINNMGNIAAPWLSLLLLMTLPVILGSAIWVYFKGHKPAIYFIPAYFFLVIGVVVIILVSRGQLPYNALTSNAFFIGSTIQVTLFTLAITDKINRYKSQMALLQQGLIAQSAAHAVTLEATVKSRTEELHYANEELQSSEEELRQNLEELQATQDALHASNKEIAFKAEQMRRLFNGIPAMVYQFMIDAQGEPSFLLASDGTTAIFQISPQELLLDASGIIKKVHPEDVAIFRKSITYSAKSLQIWKHQFRVKIGEDYRWIEGSAMPDQLEDGGCIWSGMMIDIHDKTLASQTIKQNQQELQMLNEHMNTSMEHMQYALEEVNAQKQLVDKKNNDIMASLNYAKRIQNSILPSHASMQQLLPNSFVFYKPKDIVSGDFYWTHHTDRYLYIATIDCTGHGVPGALMSLIGNSLLQELVISREMNTPNSILELMHLGLVRRLSQDANQSIDGMEGGICIIDRVSKKMQFAGAKMPLIYFKKGEMHYIKGDRSSIGMTKKLSFKKFTAHEIALDSPVQCYLCSDGFQDQFGEATGRKFMSSNLKQLLIDVQPMSFDSQLKKISHEFETWKGAEKQIDDVMLLGFEVDLGKK